MLVRFLHQVINPLKELGSRRLSDVSSNQGWPFPIPTSEFRSF